MTPRAEGLPRGIEVRGGLFRHRTMDRPGGRRIWRAFPTLDECVEDQRACRAHIRDGLPVPAIATRGPAISGRITLWEYLDTHWWEDYVSRGLKKSTRDDRRALLDNHIPSMAWVHAPIGTIRRTSIRDWAREQVRLAESSNGKQGLSRGLVGDLLWVFSDAFALAGTEPLTGVTANPLSRKIVLPRRARRSPSLERSLEPEDIPGLMGHLRIVDLLPLLLQFLCGLRIGEAFGLRKRDVDLAGATLRIRQQYGMWMNEERPDAEGRPTVEFIKPWTKTDAGRRDQHIPDVMVRFIDRWVTEVHGGWENLADDDLLCIGSRGGTKWLETTYRRRVQRAAKIMGIQIVLEDSDESDAETAALKPHDLRKAISSLLNEDPRVTPIARSAFLGHKHKGVWDESATTAQVYTLPVRASLLAIADVVADLAARIGELWPPEADLLSTKQVADILGLQVGAVLKAIKLDQLKTTPNPRSSTRSWWVTAEEAERYAATRRDCKPAGSMTIPEAAAILGVGEANTNSLARTGMLEVVRVGPNGRAGPRTFVTVEALQRYLDLRQGIADGSLVTFTQAASLLGWAKSTLRQRIDEGEVPVAFQYANSARAYLAREWIDQRLQQRDGYTLLAEAALSSGLSEFTLRQWLGLSRIHFEAGRSWVRRDELEQVLAQRAASGRSLVRSLDGHVSVTELAKSARMTSARVVAQLGEHLQQGRWVPAQVAEEWLAGLTPDAEADRDPGWLDSVATAEFLSVSIPQAFKIVEQLSVRTRKQGRNVYCNLDDLVVAVQRRTPAEGYVAAADAARSHGLTPDKLTKLLRCGRIPGIRYGARSLWAVREADVIEYLDAEAA